MYYIVYGILYLLSLLPFWLLYRLSDFVFFMLYHVTGYRKAVVMQNLQNAFPGKSSAELKQIQHRFYRNFCDIWVELLKMFSISKRQVRKRVSFDFGLLEELYAGGHSVQAFAGHFMNWEYANASVPQNQPFPFLGVYMPVTSKIFERLTVGLRSRFGTILLRAGNLKQEMIPWESRQYMIGLAADQSPANPDEAFWLNFMSQRSGFIRKPWTKVKALNQPAVYMRMLKVKRGYYRFEVVPLALDPSLYTAEELVLKYRELLEYDIYNNPANYLWTHRRWKKKWKEEYKDLWIDNVTPAPYQE